jgi:hypothetical protein
VKKAKKNSARATLFKEFINEWSAIESQCRERWTGEFGGLMGKTEDEIRRYWLDRESDLRTLGGKEDIYREQMTALAQPLLIAAAGFLGINILPLKQFLDSTAHQNNVRNFEAESIAHQWLEQVHYKSLHQEETKEPWWKRILLAVFGESWKLVVSIIGIIAGIVVVAYVVPWLRSKGVPIKE